MIKINEIYKSVQGESTWAGVVTCFVRTSGCNLRCTYCDSKFAYNTGESISLDEVFHQVIGSAARYVCITGGEPLLQADIVPLMKKLCDQGLSVSLETSGSLPCQDVDRRVKKVVDIKTPDSGAAESFQYSNLEYMTALDEFKFVICSENDFIWAENLVNKFSLTDKCTVLYSPSFAKISENWLAEKIVSENSKARLQLQLHKYIWSENARRV